MPRLKKATINDLAALLDLEQQCFQDYYAPHRFSRQQFRYYLKNPQAYFRIAVTDDTAIGYLIALFGSGARAGLARVLSLGVHPSYRRQGLGTKLLRDFLSAAKKNGSSSVTLEVAASNVAAQDLFVRAGFVKGRALPAYYSPRHDALRMQLNLNGN